MASALAMPLILTFALTTSTCVLAKTVGPKKNYVRHKIWYSLHTFPPVSYMQIRSCSVVLRNVKKKFSLPYVGLYTGPLCCILKHP